VVLPAHLRRLAAVTGEVPVEVAGEVTQSSVLDALEAAYPVLLGTIRDRRTGQRRAFVRFFACESDLSNEPPEATLPAAVTGAVPGRRGDGRRLSLRAGSARRRDGE